MEDDLLENKGKGTRKLGFLLVSLIFIEEEKEKLKKNSHIKCLRMKLLKKTFSFRQISTFPSNYKVK